MENNQTSTGITTENVVFDRENGKTFVIQYPSFEFRFSDSSLSFKADWYQLPPTKLIALLKCLLILQSLSEGALEEASEELKKIADFHSDRLPQASQSVIPNSSIRGKLKTQKTRPPIIFEP